MDINELADWAYSKSCEDRRRSGTCDHPGCDDNESAVAYIRAMKRFDGRDASGNAVSGWLIED